MAGRTEIPNPTVVTTRTGNQGFNLKVCSVGSTKIGEKDVKLRKPNSTNTYSETTKEIKEISV